MVDLGIRRSRRRGGEGAANRERGVGVVGNKTIGGARATRTSYDHPTAVLAVSGVQLAGPAEYANTRRQSPRIGCK